MPTPLELPTPLPYPAPEPMPTPLPLPTPVPLVPYFPRGIPPAPQVPPAPMRLVARRKIRYVTNPYDELELLQTAERRDDGEVTVENLNRWEIDSEK